MSLCTIIQTKDDIYIASDSASSSIVDGNTVRVLNNVRKIFTIGEFVIFCSGVLHSVDELISKANTSDYLTIDKLSTIAKEINNNSPKREKYFSLELLVIYKNVVHQISEYNDFKVKIHIPPSNNKEVGIIVAGIETKGVFEYVLKLINDNNSIRDLFESVYSNFNTTEIGGDGIVYKINRYGVEKFHTFKIDNTSPISNQIINASVQYLIVAEEVYGQLVAGNNLKFTNASGSFMFDENGVRIDGASLTLTGGLPLDQIAPEINDLLDTAVKTGVGYNFVVIDSNGIIATHSDGSTTQLSGDGLVRKKAGVSKPYSYLTAIGTRETGSVGRFFDTGGSRFTSGLANGAGIPNAIITLPPDFQGKDFSVSLSVKSSAPFVMANRDGDSYYVPYVDLGNFLEIVNINQVAGTFEVKGYGSHLVLDSSEGSLYNKYWAIEFSYMVVA